MSKKTVNRKTPDQLRQEIEELQLQLHEANETIEYIRTGQIDGLVVQGSNGHQVYTLKSADKTYRVFIEHMTEGAVTLNRDGLILYSNSQFASMLQTDLFNVIGLPFYEFVALESQNDYNDLFSKSWKEDCKGEIKLKRGENSLSVQLSLTTLELDEGECLSIILTDLTAQKRNQEALKEKNEELKETNQALEISNHDLQQFASIASHDLQEPLRKIEIFANLLLENSGIHSRESGQYIRKIIDSSARMKTLIIDVLNYSKLSARDLHVEPLDLRLILEELKEDLEMVIMDKHADIVIGPLPSLEGNKGQIRQVFQNIISNALKFSKEDIPPLITITSKIIGEKNFQSKKKKTGKFCLISIKDNGIGFDEKYIENIFSLFERLNPKDKFEGTGIGLAIAKKIIEKHNGLITARSCEGAGAEFQIILPLLQSQIQK